VRTICTGGKLTQDGYKTISRCTWDFSLSHSLSLSLSLSLACIGIVLQVPLPLFLPLADRNTHTIFPTVDKNQQDNTRAEFSTLEEGGSVHVAHLHSLQKTAKLKVENLA